MNYLGQTRCNIADTPFAAYTPTDWALYFITMYGGIDGAHHKTWVLDQVARILKGTQVIVELAIWDNGHSEYRICTEEPASSAYNEWVKEMLGEEIDGEYEYEYDTGCAS